MFFKFGLHNITSGEERCFYVIKHVFATCVHVTLATDVDEVYKHVTTVPITTSD